MSHPRGQNHIRARQHRAKPRLVINRTARPKTGLNEDPAKFGKLQIRFACIKNSRPLIHVRSSRASCEIAVSGQPPLSDFASAWSVRIDILHAHGRHSGNRNNRRFPSPGDHAIVILPVRGCSRLQRN
jgi:hypothetical protein